jgi:hypothetical protein
MDKEIKAKKLETIEIKNCPECNHEMTKKGSIFKCWRCKLSIEPKEE